MNSDEIMEFVTSIPKEQMVDFDWRKEGERIEDNMISEPFEFAKIYLDSCLKQQPQLLETISSRVVKQNLNQHTCFGISTTSHPLPFLKAFLIQHSHPVRSNFRFVVMFMTYALYRI